MMDKQEWLEWNKLEDKKINVELKNVANILYSLSCAVNDNNINGIKSDVILLKNLLILGYRKSNEEDFSKLLPKIL